MLPCPTCGTAARLRSRVLDEPRVTVLQCDWCRGTWLRASTYVSWLRRAGARFASSAPTYTSRPLGADVFRRRCPDCHLVLTGHRVTDLGFTLVRCHCCQGLWFDRYEWTALASGAPYRQLYHILASELRTSPQSRPDEHPTTITVELL